MTLPKLDQPPAQSPTWWICPPAQFAARQRTAQLRMRLTKPCHGVMMYLQSLEDMEEREGRGLSTPRPVSPSA